jgi:hypothetical protein
VRRPLLEFRSTVRTYLQVLTRAIVDQYLTPRLSSSRAYRTQHRFAADSSSALIRLVSPAVRNFGPFQVCYFGVTLACNLGLDLIRCLSEYYYFHNPALRGGYARSEVLPICRACLTQ